MDVPYRRAPKLVGTRLGQNLNLPDASTHLCIRGSNDHTHFPHQIRVDARGGKDADVVSSVADRDAVAHRVHGADTGINARESFRRPIRTDIAPGCRHSRHDVHQLERIAADGGQVAYSVFRKHTTDRGRRCRQKRIGRNGYFNRLRDATDLQREIQPNLLGKTELESRIRLSLKSGQLGAQVVNARLQTRKIIGSTFIRDHGGHNTGLSVGRRDGHTRNQSSGAVGDRPADCCVAGLSECLCGENNKEKDQCKGTLPHAFLFSFGVLGVQLRRRAL